MARPLDQEFHFSKACAQPNFNSFWDYMDLEKLEHLKIQYTQKLKHIA